MSETFDLTVSAMGKNLYKGQIVEITIPTTVGIVGLLPHHIQYFATTIPGSAYIINYAHKEFIIPIESGYVLFQNNACRIWSFD